MKATGGAVADEDAVGFTEHVNAGDGDAAGDVGALGVGLDAAPGTTVLWWFKGLATMSTPITITAMTAAATPAIQKGPLCSGASASDERTRSGRALLGDPAMSSNTWPSSRRKSSLAIRKPPRG